MEKFKDQTNENINNNKGDKNKSVFKNCCTPWVNIWRYEDLETNKPSSKWLDSALNDLKRVYTPSNKTTNFYAAIYSD